MLISEDHQRALDREIDLPVELCSIISKVPEYSNLVWINNCNGIFEDINLLPNVRNKHIWVFGNGDLNYLFWEHKHSQLNELSIWLVERNNTLTMVSNNFFRDNTQTLNYIADKVAMLSIPELHGTGYIDYQYNEFTSYKKLYNVFMQRIQEDRVKFFAELYANNMLDAGYVSFLSVLDIKGDGTTEERQAYSKQLLGFNKEIPKVPYRNFPEPMDWNAMEEQCKYSIVYETYNKQPSMEAQTHSVFTEKTLRALQVPNHTIICNTEGSLEALANMGLKFHPINYELAKMKRHKDQAQWLVNFLKNDPLPDNIEGNFAMAKHNNAVLKAYWDTCRTKEFALKIADLIKYA